MARCCWNVLKSTSQRIVMTCCRVIDAERRIDGCGDILCIDGPLCGPSRIFDIPGIRCCFSEHAATANSAAREQRGMDEVVIASLLTRDVADRPSEFAFHDDERSVELRSSAAARHRCKVRDEVGESDIKLTRRTVDSCVHSVDILMIVPDAKRELDVASDEIRRKN